MLYGRAKKINEKIQITRTEILQVERYIKDFKAMTEDASTLTKIFTVCELHQNIESAIGNIKELLDLLDEYIPISKNQSELIQHQTYLKSKLTKFEKHIIPLGEILRGIENNSQEQEGRSK